MKKAIWFLSILLIINCAITGYNFWMVRNLKFKEGISLTNKNLIMELQKKVVPDEEALEE
jgi:hypothetical protein